MIVYKMHEDGGFLAGDTETGITSYAYPTSPYAVWAIKNPAKIAADMISRQSVAPLAARDSERDAAWMAELTK